ncbi:MAG: hypothetical protein ACFHU9_05205 [Fluviicola sp.]
MDLFTILRKILYDNPEQTINSVGKVVKIIGRKNIVETHLDSLEGLSFIRQKGSISQIGLTSKENLMARDLINFFSDAESTDISYNHYDEESWFNISLKNGKKLSLVKSGFTKELEGFESKRIIIHF